MEKTISQSLELLKKYFESESPEEIQEDWDAVKNLEFDGPSIDDVINYLSAGEKIPVSVSYGNTESSVGGFNMVVDEATYLTEEMPHVYPHKYFFDLELKNDAQNAGALNEKTNVTSQYAKAA